MSIFQPLLNTWETQHLPSLQGGSAYLHDKTLTDFFVQHLPKNIEEWDEAVVLPDACKGPLAFAIDKVFPSGSKYRTQAWEWLMDQDVDPNGMAETIYPFQSISSHKQPLFFFAENQEELDVFIQSKADPGFIDSLGVTYLKKVEQDKTGKYSSELRQGIQEWLDWVYAEKAREPIAHINSKFSV